MPTPLMHPWDPKTGVAQKPFEAKLDPVATQKTGELTYFANANATLEPPPETDEEHRAVRISGAWEVKRFWPRGTVVYNKETGRRDELSEPVVGELPEHLTTEEPSTEQDVWTDAGWFTDHDAVDLEVRKSLARQATNETEKRLAAGTRVVLSTNKAFTVQMRDALDKTNFTWVTTHALVCKALGDDVLIAFRDADNVVQQLTPDEVVEMASLVMGNVQTILVEGWAAKDKALSGGSASAARPAEEGE